MSIKMVGFDLDGTIVDSLDDLHTAVNYALAKENLPQRNRDEIRSFIGNGVLKLLSRSLAPVEDESILQRMKVSFDEYYSEHYCDKTKPYDGIELLFSKLSEKNIGIFIFSNKPLEFVEVIARKLFPNIEFKAILGGCSKFKVKPAPDNFLSFIGETDVSLEQCIYVGDSNVDISFAKNANIKSIGVTWGYMSKEAVKNEEPDYLVDTVEELIQVLDKKIKDKA